MKKTEAISFISTCATNALIMPIRAYQRLAFLRRRSCRFYPTCSEYAVQSLQRFGVVTGLCLAVARICKCHPWHDGGIDVVPPHGFSLSGKLHSTCRGSK